MLSGSSSPGVVLYHSSKATVCQNSTLIYCLHSCNHYKGSVCDYYQLHAHLIDRCHNTTFKNPYVFPPICLISHVIKYMRTLLLLYTIIVPDMYPRHCWWPLLGSSCSSQYFLAVARTVGALLMPSKNGYLGVPPMISKWCLLAWAFHGNILEYNHDFVI